MNHTLLLTSFVSLEKNQKKLFFLFLLITSALLSGLLPAHGADFEGGNGTSTDPYIIITAEQLDAVRNEPDKCYRLGADIDLSGINWEPIGDGSMPFSGTFDGNGHVIRNMTIDRTYSYTGLFGLDSAGTIKNVGVEDANITGKRYTGGLAGFIDSGSVIRSYVTGTITGTDYVGGLVGSMQKGNITLSYSSVTVKGNSYVAGLAGSFSTSALGNIVKNSYATGSVEGTSFLGGLIGENMGVQVTNSYASVNVTGGDYAGGLVGYNIDGYDPVIYATFNHSYSSGNVTGSGTYVGDLYGSNISEASGSSEYETEVKMREQATFVSWDFTDIWAIDEGVSMPYLRWPEAPIVSPEQGILYVDSAIQYPGTGSSWGNALKYLSTAIEAANNNAAIKEIRVAKGTYYPTGAQNGANRDNTFALLRGGLKLYGGYPNGGGARDIEADPTILSGNIQDATKAADNSYHVMVIAGIDASADSLVVDGFTITGGYANGGSAITLNGQGILGDSGGGLAAYGVEGTGKTVIRNCVFSKNHVDHYGGGMYIRNSSSPQITHCVFRDNQAGAGGGTYNHSSFPVFIHCLFMENNANNGGGMGNLDSNSPTEITHCTFSGNQADIGGGLFNTSTPFPPVLTNCLFSGNQANTGGAIYNDLSSPHLFNCTLSGNLADYGSSIYNNNECFPEISNSIIYGDSTKSDITKPIYSNGIYNYKTSKSTITYSLVQGRAADAAGHNLDGTVAYSLFVNAPAASTAPFTGGNYQLLPGSRAINAGNNDSLLNALPPSGGVGGGLDLADNPRIFDQANGGIVDFGAYEYQGSPDSTDIAMQPEDIAGCIGADAAFSVTADGANLQYQWQFSTDNGKTWNNATDGTSGTLELSNIQTSDSGTYYRVIVTGDWSTDTSQAAVLKVNPLTAITIQPKDETVCDGGNATFTVAATGTDLKYQWQSSTDGTTWNNVTDGTGATLKLSNIQISANGTQYRVVVNGTCNNVTSSIVTLTVNAKATITTQPKDETICDGGNAIFTVEATGTDLKYQWQSSVDGTTWNNVTGETGTTLKLSNIQASANGTQYRVVVNGTCNNITSSIVTLTVNAKTAITTQPKDETVCDGGNATFTVGATGTDLKYQWQSSTDGTTWNNVTGETGTTLKLSNIQASANGTQYRAVVDGACNNVTSSIVTLTVNTKTAIATQPKDETICDDGNATFKVEATGTDLKYQWQSSADGTTWNNVTGGTSATLKLSNLTTSTNGTQYRVAVNGTCDNVTSSIVTLTVNSKTAITTQPKDETVCDGGNATFTVEATGTDLKYQWQSSADGTTWNNVTGETDATLKLSNIQTSANGTQYRVVVNGTCDNVTSSIVTLTINAKTTITAQSEDETICDGGNATFKVEATGTGLKYQWQSSADGTTWNNVSDGTSETLKLSNIQTSGNGIQYRVVVNGTCENLVSDAVTLTVNPLPAITITADKPNPVSKGIVTHLTATGAGTYQWANGLGIQSGWNDATLTLRPQDDATYTVTGTSAEGCTSSQSYDVKIVVDYKLVCNNIVSPNGDGKNDTWIIQNISSYLNNKVMIFDRTGRMIYEKENYDNQWNGTINSRSLHEGTYYYVFIVDGGKKIFKGYIELL